MPMVGVVMTRTKSLLSAEVQVPHPPSSVAHSVAVFVGSECESLRLDAESGVLAGSVLTASPVLGVIHGDQH